MEADGEFLSVTSLGDLLLRTTSIRPHVDALVFAERRMTYQQLADAAIERARGLIGLGIEPGEHVGILLPSCPDCAEVLFAIALVGAVAVPINARYRGDELAYVIENADLVALVTTTRVAEQVNFVERLRAAFPGLDRAGPLRLEAAPYLRHVVLINDESVPGFVTQTDIRHLGNTVTIDAVHERRQAVRVRDTSLILYTSGTTSNPKGCLLSHEAIVRTGQALARRYQIKPDDRFWSPLPMFHIAAILPLCSIVHAGGTYVSMQAFNAGQALSELESERATLTYPCFAPFIADMIYHPDFRTRDLSRITLMNSNLAVQSDSFREELRAALPNAVQVGSYGLTEASGTVCTHSPDDPYDRRVGKLGRPLPGVSVIIRRPDGTEAARDEVGEITVRSPGNFHGYYKDPAKTAEALRDGWLRTGDLGSLDRDGYIMFHGRTKDMLKIGGENVAAAEIEALVGQHPSVKLCQVVGTPDPRLTEVAVAFVELRPGAAATADDILVFCRGRIASFKVPYHVRFVTEWPMSASKIQKFALAKMFEREDA